MIEPELFKFNPPLNRHSYLKKQWDKQFADIEKYELTHSISVLLTDTINIPKDLETVFSNNSQYYFVQNVTLGSIIDPVFIQSFVKNGNVEAISLNTRIGLDDCISITNDNFLHMSLTKNSYQSICLPVNDSKIVLNLKDLSVNSKHYQRIKDCFDASQTKFDILIDWEPHSGDVCPSSIASYFHDKGMIVKECFPRSTVKRKYNMTVPNGKDTTLLDTWLSYYSLDIKIDDDNSACILPDGKLIKSNSNYVSQIIQINWTGCFTKSKVKSLLNTLRNFMKNSGKSLWISVHMEPFSNTPYNCSHRTIILNPDDTLFISNCSRCKNY
ncbi:ribonuclease P protein subunit p40-like [Adelges cooleyi]|uniref:ribonuclease P protein subunit p40-like n=1 Tax=Adelges cooleyi TaxID=133065 RepID=UPI0021803F88|nr:ribonuclease P protein subunit p40-like [Adelges cooleyi]